MTPAKLAAWEAERFDPLRRIRDLARSTVVDDALPEDAHRHPAEPRSALDEIG